MDNNFLLWSVLGLSIPIIFYLTAPKYDPRFAGFRLANKGVFLGFLAPFFFVLGGYLESVALNAIGYFLFAIGFIGVSFGIVKHWKLFFSRTIDAKRYVDPGYDLPYFECPHCHGSTVRLDALPCICPACRKKIKKTVSRQRMNRTY